MCRICILWALDENPILEGRTKVGTRYKPTGRKERGVWSAKSMMLTVPQIARMTGRSRRTIIRWFQYEPGVVVFDSPERMHKRRYRTLRIPRTVLERVITERGLSFSHDNRSR